MAFSYRYIFLKDLKLLRGLKKIYGLNLLCIFRIGKILGIQKEKIWKYKFGNPKVLLRIRKLLYKKFFIGARLKKILSLRRNFLRKFRIRRSIFFDYGLPVHGQRTKTNAKTSKSRGLNLINLKKKKNILRFEQRNVKQKKKYKKLMKKILQNSKFRKKKKDPWKFKRTFYTRKKAFWVI
jgi:ribosomal protein S13